MRTTTLCSASHRKPLYEQCQERGQEGVEPLQLTMAVVIMAVDRRLQALSHSRHPRVPLTPQAAILEILLTNLVEIGHVQVQLDRFVRKEF